VPCLAAGAGDLEEGGGGIDGLRHHLDGLEVGSVRIAGVGAGALELVGDPLGGGFACGRAGGAPFIRVVGQFLDAVGEVGGGDVGRGRASGGRSGGFAPAGSEARRHQRGG